LVAIGDSLTQGFQHLAISRPEWSYPAMIARALGLGQGEFRLPEFGPARLGGIPLNLEALARGLESWFGGEVTPDEIVAAICYGYWHAARIERWWEVGPGREPASTGPLHHNLAVWGFEVADSYLLNSANCAENILPPLGALDWPIASEPMYRTALRVLNPGHLAEQAALGQVECLERIARTEGPVENLILFLGANNALPAVIRLAMTDSEPGDCRRLPHQRKGVLWRAEDFAACYAELAARVRKLQDAKLVGRVFVGTVPDVRIPPVCRGVNREDSPNGDQPDAAGFYDYYSHFWIWDDDFRDNPDEYDYLTRLDALVLRSTVNAYNTTIRGHARENGWEVVDIHELLQQLRYRSTRGRPTYVFPQGLLNALAANPSTSYLTDPVECAKVGRDPTRPIDARFLLVRDGRIAKGGLFGLDGIHPTTVAYGIVAHEFLRVMSVDRENLAARLNWDAIVANDTLITDPPAVIGDLHDWLGWVEHTGLVLKAIGLLAPRGGAG
jgi:hypothetical protein